MLFAALIIVGIWHSLGKGEILDSLGEQMEKKWSPWFAKPLGLCPPCMANPYGLLVWFLTGGELVWAPAFVLALSGLMVLVSRNLLKDE